MTTATPTPTPTPARPASRGRPRAASSPPRLFASAAGIDILRRGGNAVDAAIAAAAVMMTVEPRNGHLGGDAFLQISRPGPDRAQVVAINASGAAPTAATPEPTARSASSDHGLDLLRRPRRRQRLGAGGRRHGSRPLAELLAPAIDWAELRVLVTPRLHQMLAADAPLYRQCADSARVFLPGGRVPPVGAVLRLHRLAASLRRIAASGRDVSSTAAPLADEMIRASDCHAGLFTRDDFAAHQSEELEPLVIDYRGHTVHQRAPRRVVRADAALGDLIVLQLAPNILESFDLGTLGASGSVAATHLLLEDSKLAFADRLQYLGDPRHAAIPLDHLLSEGVARVGAIRSSIDPRRARPCPSRPGRPRHTSLVAADGSGLIVAYIQRCSGAGVVLGDTGVLMNAASSASTSNPVTPVPRPRQAPGPHPQYLCRLPRRRTSPRRQHPGARQARTRGPDRPATARTASTTSATRSAPSRPRAGRDRRPARLRPPTVRLDYDPATAPSPPSAPSATASSRSAPGPLGGAVRVARDPRTGLYHGATEVRRPGCTVLGF